ncbi:hypothetical protein [Microbispora sp. KK1-11]|uniref:hypothetical protein n=1 Tax=Microbispora sp. KK1-11 TaxID=2053005 RepID=UPI00115B645A|nr:hypothetical protein [Microbispora sp. KK1-11]TQS29153.1 hypothetical protein FLW16_12490 [Microbispora sp. KK1-11]
MNQLIDPDMPLRLFLACMAALAGSVAGSAVWHLLRALGRAIRRARQQRFTARADQALALVADLHLHCERAGRRR